MLSLDVEKETGQKFDKSRLHGRNSFADMADDSRIQFQQGVRTVHEEGTDASFGCNGFRLGVIISQHNPLVIRGLLHIAFLAKRQSLHDQADPSRVNRRRPAVLPHQ